MSSTTNIPEKGPKSSVLDRQYQRMVSTFLDKMSSQMVFGLNALPAIFNLLNLGQEIQPGSTSFLFCKVE